MRSNLRHRFRIWLLLALRRSNTYGRPAIDNLVERFTYVGMSGVVIKARQPHEFAPVLVLRPFASAAWRHEIPHIADSEFAPGFLFIGLDRAGSRIQPRSLHMGRMIFLMLICLLSVALRAAGAPVPRWISGSVAVASGACFLILLLAQFVYDRRHFLRSERDIQASIDRLRNSVPTGPEFFSATDDWWQPAVEKFAEFAAIVLADISDATEAIEWEIRFIVANHVHKLQCCLIDRPQAPEALKALIPRLAPHGRIRRFSLLSSAIGKEILSIITLARKDFDRRASRTVLHRELTKFPWAQDYWTGIRALDDEDFEVAVSNLDRAWETALGAEPKSLCLYPGLALADALTLKGALWFGPREECFARRRALLIKTYCALSTKDVRAEEKSDGYLITRLLNMQASPTLPLAPWQYSAMLTEFTTCAAALHTSLNFAKMGLARAATILLSEPHSQVADRLLALSLSNAEVALRVAEDIHETRLQISAGRYGAQAALRMGMNDKARELAAKALQLLEGSSQSSLANEFASLVRSAGASAEG
jgi:hypothetical protein